MTKSPKQYLQNTPWNQEKEAIWIGSTLLLRRNLADSLFPNKLSIQEKERVFQLLQNDLKEKEKFHFFEHATTTIQEKEFVYEHFFFLRGFEEPPNGSTFAIHENGQIILIFNMSDHLQIRMLSPTNDWDKAWNQLIRLSDPMEQGFAFSPKFGYLTSDPASCGTALTVSVYLHIPGLIHTNQLQTVMGQNEEIIFMGLSGGVSEFIGDIIILQNNYCLGMSEEAIFHTVQMAATKIMGAEKTIRSHLKQSLGAETRDLISKAFGILLHCYQLEAKEALDLLSIMRFGLALGELQNVSDQKLLELSFLCRRGHLLHKFPELKEQEEIEKKRASYLKEELQGMSLVSEKKK